jgi:hypothetical protein
MRSLLGLALLLLIIPQQLAHAEDSMPAAEEQMFSASAGLMLGIPAGDYAADNNSGIGLYVNGTAKIVGRLAFTAQLSQITLPNENEAGFLAELKLTTLGAGVRFHIPVGPIVSPSPLRILFHGMLTKTIVTPSEGTLGETSGIGGQLDIGLSYRLHPNISIEGSTGYLVTDTERNSVSFLLELLHFTAGVQAHF